MTRSRLDQERTLLAVMVIAPIEAWYVSRLIDESGINAGSIYPILVRFERVGWVASRWESESSQVAGRPRRRLYSLTREGRRVAVGDQS